MAVKNGWHTVYGIDVYVEDGMVTRATKLDRNGYEVPAWIYYHLGWGQGWVNVSGKVSLEAFRSGFRRGSYTVM